MNHFRHAGMLNWTSISLQNTIDIAEILHFPSMCTRVNYLVLNSEVKDCLVFYLVASLGLTEREERKHITSCYTESFSV